MKKLFFTLLLVAATLTVWAGDKYPTALYVVGNSTSFDWGPGSNPKNAPKLHKTSDKVYKGFVKFDEANGELKFLVTNSYNQGQWGAASQGVSINSTSAATVYESVGNGSSGHPDHKFKFNLDLGLYLVEVNLTTEGSETITFTKWNDSDSYTIDDATKLNIYVEGHNKVDASIKFTVSTSITAKNDIAYEINNASDLQRYSSLVKGGAGSLNGKLMADIDMNGVNDWTPIGQDQKDFKGHFDGQGHRIKNLTINNTYNNQALFGQAIQPAIIENVIIDSSCSIKGQKWAAGILGHVWGDGVIIRNCGNEANVTGTEDTCAGILGCSDDKIVHIYNCYNTGKISSPKWNAGICGWMGKTSSSIKNCYNIGTISGNEIDPLWRRNLDAGNATNNYTTLDYGNGTKISSAKVSSGELCYKLNGNQNNIIWYQTLHGTDSYPYPFDTHKQVYQVSETSYSNIPASGGKVQISDADDLVTFSAEVNAGNEALSAELTEDIDMAGATYTPIGTDSHKYGGTFDGQGHRIKNLIIDTNVKEQGLFSVCAGGATIKNLVLGGSIKSTADNWANAAFVAVCNGSGDLTFENCGNEASVEGTSGNNAAFLGKNWSTTGLRIVLKNCYNTGTIKGGSYNAAFVGESNGKEVSTENCYNMGSVERNDGGNNTWINGTGTKSITNCYTTLSSGELSGLTPSYSEDKITSGELCFLLNGNQSEIVFTQDLSQEGHPIFGSKQVHAANWFDTEKWDIFYNEEGSSRTAYILNLDETKTSFNLDPNFTLTAKNVSMTRTISAGKWNTFCSPVAIAKSNFSAVKKLSGATQNGENYTMNFTDETAEYLEAGKPYMVQVETTINELSATNVPVANAASASGPFNGLSFNGTFTNGNAPLGSFIISNNVFYLVDTDTNTDGISEVALKAFRGYITTTSSNNVKALTFDFDDDATGISLMEDGRSQMEDGAIYNVAGQRINKMQKGINIVNGKKILK